MNPWKIMKKLDVEGISISYTNTTTRYEMQKIQKKVINKKNG